MGRRAGAFEVLLMVEPERDESAAALLARDERYHGVLSVAAAASSSDIGYADCGSGEAALKQHCSGVGGASGSWSIGGDGRGGGCVASCAGSRSKWCDAGGLVGGGLCDNGTAPTARPPCRVSRRAAPSAGSSASVVSSVASVWLTGTVCCCRRPASAESRSSSSSVSSVLAVSMMHTPDSADTKHQPCRDHSIPSATHTTRTPIITVPHRGQTSTSSLSYLSATTPPLLSERSIVVSQAPGDLSLFAFVGEPIFTRSRRRWWRLSN